MSSLLPITTGIVDLKVMVVMSSLLPITTGTSDEPPRLIGLLQPGAPLGPLLLGIAISSSSLTIHLRVAFDETKI
jgi:hypothetical protein